MNLALRGIEADLGPRDAETFTEDQHPGPASGLHHRQPTLQSEGGTGPAVLEG